MLPNIWGNVLIILYTLIEITTQFFLPPSPCLCARPAPVQRCGSHCFQVPMTKPLELPLPLSPSCTTTSYGGSYAPQAQIQQQQQSSTVGYLSGSSYGQHYIPSSSFQTSAVNLQQQRQQYEQQQQQQTYQYKYQPPQYVPETTPYSSGNSIEQLVTTSFPPQLAPLQYDTNYVLDSLNDVTNRTTAMYLSPLPATEEMVEITKQTSLSPSFLPSTSTADFYDEIFPTPNALEIQNLHRTARPMNKLQRTSFDVLRRRNAMLMKDALRRNHASKTVAFSPATCNSRRLGKVILEAIMGDVAESKRSVTAAAEVAYHGVKFDVICAQGDFSYTVHTRRYCEATRNNITCFAFR